MSKELCKTIMQRSRLRNISEKSKRQQQKKYSPQINFVKDSGETLRNQILRFVTIQNPLKVKK